MKTATLGLTRVENGKASHFLGAKVYIRREVLQTEFRKLRRKLAAAGCESRKIMAHLSENPSECSVRPASNRTKFSVRFCGLRQCHVHFSSFASRPQLVRIGWRTCSRSCSNFQTFKRCVFRVWSTHVVRKPWHCRPGKPCETCTWLRSKISRDIWQISCEIWRLARQEFWKKLDAASRFKSFFSLSLERQRSAGEKAHRCTYTGASVFDRRQKFCEPAARLDGLVNLR